MLHNIFEKTTKRKSNKPKLKTRIVADIHEKDSMILSELKEDNNIELQIDSLKIGDYLIGEIIIERKTINDFISSMLDRRLVEQLNQMQSYKQRLLIIEGNINDLYIKINTNVIRGLILSIITRNNTNLIFTQDYKDTANYLIVLAKQQIKPKTEISLHARIPKTIIEKKQYILESFPDIGPKKSKKLLEKFKNLDNVFNATEKELKEILGKNSVTFKNLLNS